MDREPEAKWKNRARVEAWAFSKGANLDFSCDAEGMWTVVVRWADGGRTWHVESGTCEGIEAACTTAIDRLQAGGYNVPALDGPSSESATTSGRPLGRS